MPALICSGASSKPPGDRYRHRLRPSRHSPRTAMRRPRTLAVRQIPKTPRRPPAIPLREQPLSPSHNYAWAHLSLPCPFGEHASRPRAALVGIDETDETSVLRGASTSAWISTPTHDHDEQSRPQRRRVWPFGWRPRPMRAQNGTASGGPAHDRKNHAGVVRGTGSATSPGTCGVVGGRGEHPASRSARPLHRVSAATGSPRAGGVPNAASALISVAAAGS